jgi:two-component system NtrC family sensor kinase
LTPDPRLSNQEWQEKQQEIASLYERLKGRLLQSEKLALLGQMAAGIAHEMNSPITGILSRTQLIARQLSPDHPARPDLDGIVAEGRRLARIVRHLLDYSRPHLEPRAVRLGEMMEQSLFLAWHEIKYQNHGIIQDYTPNLPLLRGDPGQLSQVFINLITNASHAMGEGGRLTLRAQPSATPGFVRAEVTDTGCGIVPEHLARIFEPFFTTREPGEGTGLGLFVGREIITRHGGTITVHSEVGKGTTFVIELPVAT